MDRTVKVEWENVELDPKFSRYLKSTSTVLAHNPDCIKAKKGDRVIIGETRPISKRKHFAIVEVKK
jgi:small subunit ribosomal protein S17